MIEAASTSETSVNFCQTTRRYIPEGSHLHTCRRENLKSHQNNSKVAHTDNVLLLSSESIKELYSFENKVNFLPEM
jgi:hypothetical protein